MHISCCSSSQAQGMEWQACKDAVPEWFWRTTLCILPWSRRNVQGLKCAQQLSRRQIMELGMQRCCQWWLHRRMLSNGGLRQWVGPSNELYVPSKQVCCRSGDRAIMIMGARIAGRSSHVVPLKIISPSAVDKLAMSTSGMKQWISKPTRVRWLLVSTATMTISGSKLTLFSNLDWVCYCTRAVLALRSYTSIQHPAGTDAMDSLFVKYRPSETDLLWSFLPSMPPRQKLE